MQGLCGIFTAKIAMKNIGLYLKLLPFLLLVVLAGCMADAYKTYHKASIETIEDVYDGDTIKDVKVKLLDTNASEERKGEIWPGLVIEDNTLYTIFDLRIRGIDTPELKPSTKNPDGSIRSEESRDAEKQAALKARQALMDLLKNHGQQFYLADPDFGKYGGRILSDMYVDDRRIHVADYLIERGHAKPYDGKTKPVWDF